MQTYPQLHILILYQRPSGVYISNICVGLFSISSITALQVNRLDHWFFWAWCSLVGEPGTRFIFSSMCRPSHSFIASPIRNHIGHFSADPKWQVSCWSWEQQPWETESGSQGRAKWDKKRAGRGYTGHTPGRGGSVRGWVDTHPCEFHTQTPGVHPTH